MIRILKIRSTHYDWDFMSLFPCLPLSHDSPRCRFSKLSWSAIGWGTQVHCVRLFPLNLHTRQLGSVHHVGQCMKLWMSSTPMKPLQVSFKEKKWDCVHSPLQSEQFVCCLLIPIPFPDEQAAPGQPLTSPCSPACLWNRSDWRLCLVLCFLPCLLASFWLCQETHWLEKCFTSFRWLVTWTVQQKVSAEIT